MSYASTGDQCRIRVLVANIPLPGNRFLVDLNAALAEQCDVTQSSDTFWNMEGDFDVIHLHFPHYLTYEIEKASQTKLTPELIDAVDERLRFWSARSRIVATRHVLLPHDAERDSPWERMYEQVYSYCDGVAHFGRASIEEFGERYRDTKFRRGGPRHVVIPHQNYCSLPNVVERKEARMRLRIQQDANVMLVFGAIRSDAERELILSSFHGLAVDRKLLLVSSWREHLARVSWIRLKYWIRDFVRLYYRIHPHFSFHYGFVSEDDTQLYLNAADVLFIPRLKVLNSGNVTLGMTFGRVVVGPDSWDVGEILKETGNPVFDIESPATAVAALERGFQLYNEGVVGKANQRLATSEWSVQACAEKYILFFHGLLETPEALAV
jgi:hypothetical protein